MLFQEILDQCQCWEHVWSMLTQIIFLALPIIIVTIINSHKIEDRKSKKGIFSYKWDQREYSEMRLQLTLRSKGQLQCLKYHNHIQSQLLLCCSHHHKSSLPGSRIHNTNMIFTMWNYNKYSMIIKTLVYLKSKVQQRGIEGV